MALTFLKFFLNTLARLTMLRYRPRVVAITGSVGKTSTKEAIKAVLSQDYRVRSSGGNLNNDLGVPLTIIGDFTQRYYQEGSGFGFWFRVLLQGLTGLVYQANYPDILVLEYGADHPGDIEKLVARFRPEVGVVTAIGAVPAHVEFFQAPSAVAVEKSKLIKSLSQNNWAVLNQDDPVVLEMKGVTIARTITFGFSDESQIKISNYDIMFDEANRPEGVAFKLHYKGTFVPVRIAGSLGRPQALAAAAAASVGIALGLNLVQVSEGLQNYRGLAGRMRVFGGIKNTTVIDDTYNASPAAMTEALETLRALPAKRRIVVVGDMLELGKYSISAHENIGSLAGSIANVLVCVGDKSRLVADAATSKLGSENIFTFDTSEEARNKVQELIQPGDVVLVKGSQGMRMEKIVEEIMAQPERKSELLVRQSKKWLAKS